VNQVQSLK